MKIYTLPERLDVITSPDIEKDLLKVLTNEKPNTLVCDYSQTKYVSSAGLRVMIIILKHTKNSGTPFILIGMNEAVFNIFNLSGFSNILDIRDSI